MSILTGKLCICQTGVDSEVPYPLVLGALESLTQKKFDLFLAHSFMLSLQHYCKDMFPN